MTVDEIKHEVTAPPEPERELIAASLMGSLSSPAYGVSDEEVAERKRQLDSGEVEDISLKQLVSGIELPESDESSNPFSSPGKRIATSADSSRR